MFKVLRNCLILFSLCLIALVFDPVNISAEDKASLPSGQNIPKLEVSPDDPKLVNGHVYPNWGPVCQRYTYSVIYLDEKGRSPAYVKIYFNGKMIDMEKENPEENNYINGVKYIYQYVPNKLGSNFYYFEASNGLGKTRSNIIDSPDNGPVLFNSSFENNEIAVVDVASETKILSYDVKDEWVGGVALSDDGKYLAAKTHKKIYLFDTSAPEKPVWVYEGIEERPGDVKGGIDISGDGSRIIASIGGNAILFDQQSNQPIWIYRGSGNQAYNVAISKDGHYMAMGTAGSVSSTAQGYKSSETTNLLIFWSEKSQIPLWQYHADGNFHDVSLSDDGSFISGATGCPDRRFYLFGKDSNQPIIRSDMLTRDSPVHRAKVSADGQYIAVGSESDAGAVFLFSQDSTTPIWKFPAPYGSSFRALNITPDGQYMGGATFRGDVYIFEKSSNVPVSHWKVDAALGGIDIADDGSFVATGGTDSQLHIFQKGVSERSDIDFNEYVEEIDISGNGQYIAVGTAGSVYFFESFDMNLQPVTCQEIKEPIPEAVNNMRDNDQTDNSINFEPINDANVVNTDVWPGMLLGFGFAISLIILGGYILIIKLDVVSKLKSHKQQPSLEIEVKDKLQKPVKLNKQVVVILSAICGILFVLTIISVVINVKNQQEFSFTDQPNQELNETSGDKTKQIGCGNNICEPDYGETKTNCPSDCSAGN